MKKEYIPKNIEFAVQEYWKKKKTFEVTEDKNKEKYYCLPMLPYPSGKLHMGHVRNYTISDVISRHQRMLGKNVLQPMGWDAFGLPAEEAAIKNKTEPSVWTYKNIEYMKKQLQSLGFSYDWSREITTCKPEYYRWEQWFFIQLYKKKLVYKKNSIVNWCVYDKTVLANEQVVNGCCWRCNNKIIFKKIPQWFMKIRKYAELLYQDLKKLNHWPEKVKNMQKNWIGRKKGFEITFNIFNSNKILKSFITKLDHFMGTTCILISPFHKIAIQESKKNKKIKKFINSTILNNLASKDTEKIVYEGIDTHIFVIHPINKKKIPIWVTHFIHQVYGIDSIISIPGHNKHHWLFSIKNHLEIQYILSNQKNIQPIPFTCHKNSFCNSKPLNNLYSINNTKKITKILETKNIIKKKIHYQLKDWCISRQRYWGTPIPMATMENGTIIPILEKDLPVLLPIHDKFFQNSISINPKKNIGYNISINNQKAIQETDTFDTFIESSWYYVRYTCPKFQGMINPVSSKYWLPIDQYVGGIEHATMHLIYFRFFHKLLYEFKLVDCIEPVKNLLCQGMVLAEAFYYIGKNNQKNWVNSSSVLIDRNKEGKIIKSYTKKGKNLICAGMIKMSKSKNNGIEPSTMIEKYGADTVRLFIMFAAPIESSLEWNESGVKGIYRFLKKIWNITYDYINKKNIYSIVNINELNNVQKELFLLLHKTIKKVSDDMIRRKTFNTAIAEIMKFVNQLIKHPLDNKQDQDLIQESLVAIIKMLHPFSPHICFFLWKNLQNKDGIDTEKWPIANEKILSNKKIIFIIQINGKTKSTIEISHDATKEEIFSKIKKQKIIQKNKNKINFHNIIYIPKKIINFII